MPVKNLNKLNIPKLPTPKPLPPPDRNMYKRKGNKDLPPPARLPAPLREHVIDKYDSLPSTYNNSMLPPTFSNGLLSKNIFPTANTISNFKTQSMSPSPIFPVVTMKPNKKKLTNKRCKRGTRRNKKTMLCEKNKYYMRKLYTKRNMKRCPNGKHRNPITLNCEPKALFTRYRI